MRNQIEKKTFFYDYKIHVFFQAENMLEMCHDEAGGSFSDWSQSLARACSGSFTAVSCEDVSDLPLNHLTNDHFGRFANHLPDYLVCR